MLTHIIHKTLRLGLLSLVLLNSSQLWADSLPNEAASCHLYGIHDAQRSHSQLFTLSAMPIPTLVTDTHPLGQPHYYHDLETLTIHPNSNLLYTAASDNAATVLQGNLFTVSGTTGQAQLVGQLDYPIESLTFTQDGRLWGWSNGVGLLSINTTTATAEVALPSEVVVEELLGITADTFLAAVKHTQADNIYTHLWEYDHAEQTATLQCENLSGEIEAMVPLKGSRFLVGLHNDPNLYGLDTDTCFLIPNVVPNTPFEDIEGLALPNDCPLAQKLKQAFKYNGYVEQFSTILQLIGEPPLGAPQQTKVFLFTDTLSNGEEKLFYTRLDVTPHPAPANARVGRIERLDADGNIQHEWIFRDDSNRLMQQPVWVIPIAETAIAQIELVLPGGIEMIEIRMLEGTATIYNSLLTAKLSASKAVPIPADAFNRGADIVSESDTAYRIEFSNGATQSLYIEAVELNFDLPL